jgi:redox-sensitive bicupin YhaK (pirin superfamily)
MPTRSIRQLLKATEVSEGAGVTVYRTIGTPGLRNLDPFLMLDYFNSDNPQDYIAGFPDHPHRGFITLTYMLDGYMLHRDSMGNEGNLRSGGAQWMKAASGVIHSEMPRQANGLMRGFQLWINLPASQKMSAPEYQEFTGDRFPVVEADGARVKILSGTFQGTAGPIRDEFTGVQYRDIQLPASRRLSQPLDAALRGFIYVYEGDLTVGGMPLPQHSFAVLDEGDSLQVEAGKNGARFIVVAGKPLGEPIVQYGPFVMTSMDDIKQAVAEYNNGTLVRKKGTVTN